jgi:hypothetical protein
MFFARNKKARGRTSARGLNSLPSSQCALDLPDVSISATQGIACLTENRLLRFLIAPDQSAAFKTVHHQTIHHRRQDGLP